MVDLQSGYVLFVTAECVFYRCAGSLGGDIKINDGENN